MLKRKGLKMLEKGFVAQRKAGFLRVKKVFLLKTRTRHSGVDIIRTLFWLLKLWNKAKTKSLHSQF
jgi:hypothetical protein